MTSLAKTIHRLETETRTHHLRLVGRPSCACGDCDNDHTPRSSWCASCRASLRRWIKMTDAERRASWSRAEQRWSRVRSFGIKR